MANKEFRDEMKKNPTKAEDILWQEVRNKKLGHKLRRQHIIDDYIVDFVCLRKNLIIEVDGKIHDKQKEYDEARTEDLEAIGYKVIRFQNEDVENDIKKVLNIIKNKLNTPPSEGMGDVKIGRIWINDNQYFDNIPSRLWKFRLGETYPAQKWLEDRKGEKLAKEDIKGYQRLLQRLNKTKEKRL